ncbi:hypothetical protein B9Z55_009152 [Caenorhabditis nigoni]|uniref:Uncharacterized protein n=1 Tax=Caenorhabditis nigoni TaxID=1611254 RepID=A0A2G5UQU6_9PELO|nr:hypothetical protein B9Z55_009152 [Caenorhabditis nigoni]
MKPFGVSNAGLGAARVLHNTLLSTFEMFNINSGNPLNTVAPSAKPKRVAPKEKYRSLGYSVTGPIKRAIGRAEACATVRMNKVDKIFLEHAGKDHPALEEKQLSELDRARSELQRSLIELEGLPGLVESKLQLPEFLKEPTAKAVTTEMQDLLTKLDVFRIIKNVRNKITMITQEAAAHNKILSPANFDEVSVFQEFQELIETEDN